MKLLLHVTRDYPPLSKGGISTAVGGLARAGVAAGHRVWVVSFDAWRPKAHPGGMPLAEAETQAGVVVQRVRAPHHVLQLTETLQALAPDVVQVHHGMLWQAARSWAIAAPHLLVVHVIQAEMNRLRGVSETLSASAQSAALMDADAVAVPSAEAAALLAKHHPVLPHRVHVLPLGVDLELSIDEQEGERRLGRQGDDNTTTGCAVSPVDRIRTVVAVGRYDHTKGTTDLVAAIPLLRASDVDVEVRIVGGVPDNQRAERRWRQRLMAVGQEGIPPNTTAAVTLHTAAAQSVSAAVTTMPEARRGLRVVCLGWLSPESVRLELCRADVALFPSHAETYGLALLEAMACGVAIVATSVPGHQALLGSGSGDYAPRGVFVAPQQPVALAAVTSELLADPIRANALGAAAFAHARTLSWPAVWPVWQTFIDALTFGMSLS